ncbi:MAG: polyprenyl diphosphate synthase [Opitutales bacterium]
MTKPHNVSERLPRHVAIIMDGNGRWARRHGLPRIAGHQRGAEAVKRTLRAVRDNNIRILTLFAFSAENWSRPREEVDGLMHLLDNFLKDQLAELLKHEIKLRVIGSYEGLPADIQAGLREAEAKTAGFGKYTLGLALNYGAREEVIHAVKSIAAAANEGRLDLNELDYATFRSYLYTDDLPDPDLIIRTSGECRLSNFLLLQSAYAEIHISNVLWPEFGGAEFAAALADYGSRQRRYGKTAEQLEHP